MRQMLAATDGAWAYYSATTGQRPAPMFTYDGLVSIAEVDSTCGEGCTYLGATGTELTSRGFRWLYDGISQHAYDQILFYEFGRSFWRFADKLNYRSPDNSDCIVTGFAVLMRYGRLQI